MGVFTRDLAVSKIKGQSTHSLGRDNSLFPSPCYSCINKFLVKNTSQLRILRKVYPILLIKIDSTLHFQAFLAVCVWRGERRKKKRRKGMTMQENYT